MKQYKTEQGYALVTVLLLVVFILSVSTVFMSRSISNAKQEKMVDQNNLKVVAAEMGVEYYLAAATNEYNKLVLEYLYNDKKKKLLKDKDKDHIKQSFLNELQVNINKLNKKVSLDNNNYYYEVFPTPFYYASEKDVIHFDGLVEGRKVVESNQALLNFSMDFPFPEFQSGVGEGDFPSFVEFINLEDFYIENKPNIKCSNTIINGNALTDYDCYVDQSFNANGKYEIKNSKLFVGSGFVGNHFLDILEGSTVFSKENFNANHKLDLVGSNLYVGGDLTTDKNDTNIAEGSLVFVKNNYFSNHKVDLNNSILYIGNNLYLNKNNSDFSNDSKIYVSNDLIVNHKLGITNSNLFVGKDIYLNHKTEIKGNSKVCIVGSITKNSSLDVYDESVVYTSNSTITASGTKRQNHSKKELEDLCQFNNSNDGGDISNGWIEPSNVNVIYN